MRKKQLPSNYITLRNWCYMIITPVMILLLIIFSGVFSFKANAQNEQCFVSPTKPDIVYAKCTWTIDQVTQTLKIRVTLSKTFVDNTYGTGAIGWPNGHKFGDLTGSDKLQLALYDALGVKKTEFKMDYISASTAAPSGYKSLGVTGGDGGMILGSATNIVSVVTSLDQNFNLFGYKLTTNSPATDANYTPNPASPNWIYDVWYEAVVKLSVFGTAGFGYPVITGIHASPSKTGNNTEVVLPKPCPALSLSAVPKNVSCGATCDGSINLTISNGVPPYSILWSNGITAEDLQNLCPGSYNVTVHDAKGDIATAQAVVGSTTGHCSGSVCFESPTKPDIVYAKTTWTTSGQYMTMRTTFAETFCDNTYGTGAIGWPAGHTFANLTGSDNLQLALYNANGVKTLEFKMDYITASTAAPSGYKSLGVTGGEGKMLLGSASYISKVTTSLDQNFNTYGYVLTTNSPATDINYTPNPAYPDWIYEIWYEVTVDVSAFGNAGFGYPLIAGVHASPSKTGNNTEIVVPGSCCELALTYQKDDVDCFAGSDGSATVIPANGTPPYIYLWSTGATTQTITNCKAGTYYVTVTDSDADTCMETVSININQPPLLIADAVTISNVLINGGNQGSATVYANGGTPPYSYLWSTGATTQTITGLSAGVYHVTVSDINGCMAYDSTVITQPLPLVVVINPVVNPCYGEMNGSATANASGGVMPYSYLWSTGATTQTISNLAAGWYSVTVTDKNGAQASAGVLITQPDAPVLASITHFLNVSCNGGSDGEATVTGSGGTAPYTYLWSDGSTTDNIDNLVAGLYNVTVTDIYGCFDVASINILEPPALVASITSSINVKCYGDETGMATVAAIGGVPPYSYLWQNGATSATVSGLAAGNYYVTVYDMNGCTDVENVTITQPAMPLITSIINYNNVACYGGNDGAALVTTNGGGTSPYSYLWSNGETTQSIAGLSAGYYSVTVTDALGCNSVSGIMITQPPALVAQAIPLYNVSCYGGNDGVAAVFAFGGNPGYNYLWSNGETAQIIFSLAPGTYYVTVTDSKGCLAYANVSISEPPQLIAAIPLSTDVSCYGGNNGSATAFVNGGTQPYGYLWSNGATTNPATGLFAGYYTLTVTDARGCQAFAGINIKQPDALVAVIASSSDITCYGGNNGSASVYANGGTLPYSYLWSNGATTSFINNLKAGTYQVTVTDAKGCPAITNVTLTQPQMLSASGGGIDVSCYGGNDGQALVIAAGGTEPYSYLWSNGGTTEQIMNLSAGTYYVTVTDAYGCKSIASVVINSPLPVFVDITSVDVFVNGGNDGSATAIGSGGIPPYSYLWSTGETTATINNLSEGYYYVTVTDSRNCTTVGRVYIKEPPEEICYESPTIPSIVNATVLYSIDYNAQTVTVRTIFAKSFVDNTYGTGAIGWPGGHKFGDLVGSDKLQLALYDNNGTKKMEFTMDYITASSTVPSGYKTLGVSGGEGGMILGSASNVLGVKTSLSENFNTYGYVLTTNSPLTDNNYSPNSAYPNWIYEVWYEATVSLSAFGSAGFGYPGLVSVHASPSKTGNNTEPVIICPVVSGTAVVHHVDCDTTCTGAINLTIEHGKPPYSVIWSTGETTEDISSLCAGTYSVIIKDSRGDRDTLEVAVYDPPADCSSRICYESPTNPSVVNASSSWTIDNNTQTVKIRTTFAKTFVDNTYGTGAIGWPNGHKFGDLTGSDKLQLALYDGDGAKKLEFKMDYISASTAVPSGYKTLGVTGGDGGMIIGSSSDIVKVNTSLSENFNAFGYKLITNSPLTDNNYTPNSSYPNWIFEVWYEAEVKLSAFGSAGFGYPSITAVHASPSKTGNNSETVVVVPCIGGRKIEAVVEPAVENLLNVYPNPARDLVNIEIVPSVSGTSQISLEDVNGRIIKQIFNQPTSAGEKYKFVINTNSIAEGIYIVKYMINDKIMYKKLMITK